MAFQFVRRSALVAAVLFPGCAADVACPSGWTATASMCVCAVDACRENVDAGIDDVLPGDAASGESPIALDASEDAKVEAPVSPPETTDGSRPIDTRPADARPVDASAVGAPPVDTSPQAPSPLPQTRCSTFAGIPEPERCDDGNDNPYDGCVRCRKARCGDGFVQSGREDCERDVPGWTSANCSFDTCTRKIYTLCTTQADCPDLQGCMFGTCAAWTCSPHVEQCALPTCPYYPGRLPSPVILETFCFLGCSGNGPCPTGMTCSEISDACISASYNPENF